MLQNVVIQGLLSLETSELVVPVTSSISNSWHDVCKLIAWFLHDEEYIDIKGSLTGLGQFLANENP